MEGFFKSKWKDKKSVVTQRFFLAE